MVPDVPTDSALADALIVAVKRFRARLRESSVVDIAQITESQLSIMRRLMDGGPATAASLAQAEHVSGQAIAQTIAPLKARGLLTTTPDPSDGRKVLIGLSDEARALRASVRSTRASWLAQTISASMTEEERATLAQAVALLERLADA